MKWNSREPFWFDDKQYEERARNMTPHALWLREIGKLRSKVGSGWGVGTSSIATGATLGLATPVLWASGRALDLARRKERIVKREVERRNLPHAQKRKRDTLIPLGLAATVTTTMGAIDVFCFMDTSAGALPSFTASEQIDFLTNDPGDFFSGIADGAMLQPQQLFHLPDQAIACGAEVYQAHVDPNGMCQPGVGAVPPPSTGIGTDAAVAEASRSFKGELASVLHQVNATPGDAHAANVLAMDNGFANGSPAHEAGGKLGMTLAQAVEKHVVSDLMANTGLQGVSTKVVVDAPTKAEITGASPANNAERYEHQARSEKPASPEDQAHFDFLQALTGESERLFVFVSRTSKPVPISQRILTSRATQSCRHSVNTSVPLTCSSCSAAIDTTHNSWYHCCSCSQSLGMQVDLCEVCVAGRGCSCKERQSHMLYRRGVCSNVIDYGELETASAEDFAKEDELEEDAQAGAEEEKESALEEKGKAAKEKRGKKEKKAKTKAPSKRE